MGFAEMANVINQCLRQILVYTAGANVCSMHTTARSPFVKYHQLFTLFKAPSKRRQSTNVHGLGVDVHVMRQETADFRVKDPDELSAPWHRDAEQFLNSQSKRMFLVHWCHVIETVKIWDSLQISLLLNQFFGAAVKQAD